MNQWATRYSLYKIEVLGRNMRNKKKYQATASNGDSHYTLMSFVYRLTRQ